MNDRLEPKRPVSDGHDDEARGRLTHLLALYRREGLAAVRAWLVEEVRDGSTLVDDMTEAVLTIVEATAPAILRRRAIEDFDRDEAAAELDREQRGGNA